ncbi:hypothetical protein D3C72_2089850 [compost metagenome]
MGVYAFEFQALVDNKGIQAFLVAIADNNRHQASPPGTQVVQLIRKDRIVIVDSFHTHSMERVRLVMANLKGDNQ